MQDLFCYKNCHRTHLHYASLYNRKRLVATSRNTIGSRSKGCGWNDRTLHAEIAVIKKLGDLSKLKGCVMLVVRVNKQGEILNSEPCHDCKKVLTKCIRQYGLNKVVYSTGLDQDIL